MKEGLVLGAGYIGCRLVERLIGDGWKMGALTRNPEAAARLRAVGATVIQGLIGEDGWHKSFEGDFEAVWNTVGAAGNGLEGYRESYIKGNLSIGRWLQRSGVSVGSLWFTSSVSVYPQTDGSWVDEGASTEGGSGGSEILLEAEKTVRDLAAPAKRGVCRLAGIYGPGRHLLLARLLEGSAVVPGDPNTYLNLIHQEDAVAALQTLPSKVGRGFHVFNLSDGKPGTRGEIVAHLAERLGRSVPEFNPEQSARPMGARLEAGGKVPNRRIESSLIWKTLGFGPQFEDFRAGYGRILKDLESREGRER
ncbi:MAG: NAD-dependent epimerase/dehydratase family protein [Puniceicoccaceae bacterium]